MICERGEEFKRRTTTDPHKLLYWVFRSVTHRLAFDYELERREPGQDSRRIAFAKQIELLAHLDDKWASARAQEVDAILELHPYDDRASDRAIRCEELREAGKTGEDAWRLACLEFPLPGGGDGPEQR